MTQKQLEFLLIVEAGLQELYASEEWAEFQKRVDKAGEGIKELIKRADDLGDDIQYFDARLMVVEHEIDEVGRKIENLKRNK